MPVIWFSIDSQSKKVYALGYGARGPMTAGPPVDFEIDCA